MRDEAPDRGQRAWDLVRREWGRALADALWRGEKVQVLAGNGHLYEIVLDTGDHGSFRWAFPRIRDLTTGDNLCIEMIDCSGYPPADRLFAILEHLRADPDHVDRMAHHTPDPRMIFRQAFRRATRL